MIENKTKKEKKIDDDVLTGCNQFLREKINNEILLLNTAGLVITLLRIYDLQLELKKNKEVD